MTALTIIYIVPNHIIPGETTTLPPRSASGSQESLDQILNSTITEQTDRGRTDSKLRVEIQASAGASQPSPMELMAKIQREASPVQLYCDGWCRKHKKQLSSLHERPYVVSITFMCSFVCVTRRLAYPRYVWSRVQTVRGHGRYPIAPL